MFDASDKFTPNDKKQFTPAGGYSRNNNFKQKAASSSHSSTNYRSTISPRQHAAVGLAPPASSERAHSVGGYQNHAGGFKNFLSKFTNFHFSFKITNFAGSRFEPPGSQQPSHWQPAPQFRHECFNNFPSKFAQNRQILSKAFCF